MLSIALHDVCTWLYKPYKLDVFGCLSIILYVCPIIDHLMYSF